jgi:hypothetical protein
MPQPTQPQSTPTAAADAAALDLDALQTTEAVHESVRLASGRTVVVHGDGEGERVVLRAPSGEVELTVRLTAAGPVLSVAAVALELNAGRLSVDVDRMDLRVRGEVGVEVLGGRVVAGAGRSAYARAGRRAPRRGAPRRARAAGGCTHRSGRRRCH